jgi:TPR repeat protein
VMLVEISDTAFRNSHAADQQRLLAARTAYRSARGGEMVEILKDADGRDPNVAFMRGLGFLIRGDEASVKAGEAALRTAVEANHTLAKVLLGRVLVTAPKGITKSVDEARRLIEAAVAAGDPQAQRVAAIAYISADFGSFEPDRAASLFKRAAEAGDPQAMFHYARVLSEGIGVPANQAAAVDFLGRAAAAGLTDAQLTLGTWLLEQYRTSALSDPTEAAAWLDRAAQRGFSPIALNRLQLLYGWTGREAPWNDKTRYLALARQCSGLAEPYCQYSYSIAFSNGWGTAKDPIRACPRGHCARPRQPECQRQDDRRPRRIADHERAGGCYRTRPRLAPKAQARAADGGLSIPRCRPPAAMGFGGGDRRRVAAAGTAPARLVAGRSHDGSDSL